MTAIAVDRGERDGVGDPTGFRVWVLERIRQPTSRGGQRIKRRLGSHRRADQTVDRESHPQACLDANAAQIYH